MQEEMIITLGTEALKVTLMLAGPILATAMIVGIVVSLLQAITQINEATLTFVPKIIAISIVLVIAGPWMLEQITSYTTTLIQSFPDYLK
jgi:flagellar biosynthetic protein FliQ